MIVFDASTIVGAALRKNGTPERALLRPTEVDVLILSPAVEAEIADVLSRPKFVGLISARRRNALLNTLRHAAVWFDPTERIADCRDPDDDKYLELALAAGAHTIVSSDHDLLVLHRGVVCAS